jgi:phage tail-like protein
MTDAVESLAALHAFRFQVSFRRLDNSLDVDVCRGAFSECSGLEATMEPKVIRAGGVNFGSAQRAGPVSFATVILKRGMTRTRDLTRWFHLVAGGAYSYRMSATIVVQDAGGQPAITWELDRCMPVKFKAADLNAKGTEVGVEELHLVHEGLLLRVEG